MLSDSESENEFSMFKEPEGFRPPSPKPTRHTFERKPENVQEGTISKLNFQLIGHHSLWAHCLWNAGVVCTHYLDSHKELCKGKRILELGAAASLPSFIAAINGAEISVSTDYPDFELIQNIKNNALENIPELVESNKMNIQGYLWGSDISELMKVTKNHKFDVIIMADLLFNHSEHVHMLETCQKCLAPDGVVLCMYSSHRPWLADKDFNFFTIAQEKFNFVVEKMFDTKMKVMFEEDPGSEEVRSTIHAYSLKFPTETKEDEE